MKSMPQNPELRNNPENFHPCYNSMKTFIEVHVQINKDCECKIVTILFLLSIGLNICS